MKAVCPTSPDHKLFCTTAHECREWVVDERGEFVEDIGCLETTAGPDPGNIWTCKICGEEATVTGD